MSLPVIVSVYRRATAILEPAVLGGHAAPRPLRDAAGAPVLGAVAVDGFVVAGHPTTVAVAPLTPA